MKIAVIGTGAMGCLFSSLLSSFNDVSLFGRNADTINFINHNGIKITEKDNSSQYFYPNAFLNGSSDEKFDLAVIMVKAYDTLSALEMNRNIIDNSGYVLTLQNGLGNDEVLMRYKDKKHILIGTTEHNSSVNSVADISHGGDGVTVIGSLSDNDILDEIAENFILCGIQTIIKNDVKNVIWKKLSLNISVNALTAVYHIPTGDVIKKDIMKICKKLIDETVNTAHVIGIDLSYDEILQNVCSLAERQPYAFTSMYKDIENKRKTEIDSINGAVVKIGDKYNVNVDFNKMITSKIYELERNYKD